MVFLDCIRPLIVPKPNFKIKKKKLTNSRFRQGLDSSFGSSPKADKTCATVESLVNRTLGWSAITNLSEFLAFVWNTVGFKETTSENKEIYFRKLPNSK